MSTSPILTAHLQITGLVSGYVKRPPSEESREVIMLDTPIVYVDNTAADASVIAIVAGIVLVLGGVGTVIWMKKKKA